jgi:hypothetical protein
VTDVESVLWRNRHSLAAYYGVAACAAVHIIHADPFRRIADPFRRIAAKPTA